MGDLFQLWLRALPGGPADGCEPCPRRLRRASIAPAAGSPKRRRRLSDDGAQLALIGVGYVPRKTRNSPRPRSIGAKRLTRAEMLEGKRLTLQDLDEDMYVRRPRTRGECRDMPRPCPFAGCRHHLYLEVNSENGSIKLSFPHLQVWEMVETCSLDVADRGGTTLDATGVGLNLTLERIRQIEASAKAEVDAKLSAAGVEPEALQTLFIDKGRSR